jgi:hypothetical protein
MAFRAEFESPSYLQSVRDGDSSSVPRTDVHRDRNRAMAFRAEFESLPYLQTVRDGDSSSSATPDAAHGFPRGV